MRCLPILISVCVFGLFACSPTYGQSDSDPIDGGHVFVGGTYVSGPYIVEHDGEAITVNGLTLKTLGSSGVNRQSGNRNLQPATRRSGRPDGPPGRRIEGHRGRPNGPGGPGAFGGREGRGWEDRVQERSSAPQIEVRSFKNTLRYGGILVASRVENQVVEVSVDIEKVDFARVLLEGGEFEERELLRLQPIWDEEFTGFQPEGDLRASLVGFQKSFDAITERNVEQNRAQYRLDQAGYPLTVIGMLLGALALGHNLKWSARGAEGDQAVGFVIKAVGLILAMSALDLTWTILSSQAGQMREVNPFASDLIKSPVQLIIFKAIATTTSCGILFALKSNPKVQQAAWWMCLVCVLLTFRWVMLNSFMA